MVSGRVHMYIDKISNLGNNSSSPEIFIASQYDIVITRKGFYELWEMENDWL